MGRRAEAVNVQCSAISKWAGRPKLVTRSRRPVFSHQARHADRAVTMWSCGSRSGVGAPGHPTAQTPDPAHLLPAQLPRRPCSGGIHRVLRRVIQELLGDRDQHDGGLYARGGQPPEGGAPGVPSALEGPVAGDGARDHWSRETAPIRVSRSSARRRFPGNWSAPARSRSRRACVARAWGYSRCNRWPVQW